MALAAAVLSSDAVRLASAVLAAPSDSRTARVLDLLQALGTTDAGEPAADPGILRQATLE